MRSFRKNIAGKRFGMLTAISYVGGSMWRCKCDCGTERNVHGGNLRSGNSKSCGCTADHGHARSAKVSGTYTSWMQMRNRCIYPTRKDYKFYGGRGIKVCDRWNDFKNFLADMGERPDGMSIDRIDSNGHYEPGNCRWATALQQKRNTRATKLNEELVAAMREGKVTAAEAANRVGCTFSAAWAAKVGRAWR